MIGILQEFEIPRKVAIGFVFIIISYKNFNLTCSMTKEIQLIKYAVDMSLNYRNLIKYKILPIKLVTVYIILFEIF